MDVGDLEWCEEGDVPPVSGAWATGQVGSSDVPEPYCADEDVKERVLALLDLRISLLGIAKTGFGEATTEMNGIKNEGVESVKTVAKLVVKVAGSTKTNQEKAEFYARIAENYRKVQEASKALDEGKTAIESAVGKIDRAVTLLNEAKTLVADGKSPRAKNTEASELGASAKVDGETAARKLEVSATLLKIAKTEAKEIDNDLNP